MSWQDELERGSIGGIRVGFKSQGYRSGRRGATHEFFGRDVPFHEDTGGSAKKFSIECFIVGDDYLDRRDSLEELLRTDRVFELVSPWRRAVDVRTAGDFECTESSEQGGMARFVIPLVEAGNPNVIVSIPGTGPKLKRAVSGAYAALSNDFARVPTNGLPGDLIGRILNVLEQGNFYLRKAHGQVSSRMNVISRLGNEIDQMRLQLQGLLNTPQQLAGSFLSLSVSVFALCTTILPAGSRVSSGRGVAREGGSIPPLTERIDAAMGGARVLRGFTIDERKLSDRTPQRVQEAAITRATGRVVRLSGALGVAEILPDLAFDSANKAEQVMNEIDDMITADAGDVDDETFAALQNVRATMIDHVRQVAANLPRVSSFEVQDTLPALVVAFEIYGDAKREADIVARNKIPHPSFVPSRTTIEVLSE